MKLTHYLLITIIVLLFSALPQKTQAQLGPGGAVQIVQINTITTAVPFLRITPDARSIALGGAGAAISSDANALNWNPSRLSMNNVDDFGVSMSYIPWLREVVDDMDMFYLSRYIKIGSKTALGSSIRYFSLGNITYTDETGTTIREFKPREFATDIHLAQRLNDNLGLGISLRYIYSNLTGGISVLGAESMPASSYAADISMSYTKGPFDFGINISNIGTKMRYTETAVRDFLPTNLQLGLGFEIPIHKNHIITLTSDFNKLLVPTQPVYHQEDPNSIVSGYDPNVGVFRGMFQSFYDSPGVVSFNNDGTYNVEQGSVFREEMREINVCGGVEYALFKSYFIRCGYSYEHYSKGNRQFFTLGTGYSYKWFQIDVYRLFSLTQQNPMANTTGITLKAYLNWR